MPAYQSGIVPAGGVVVSRSCEASLQRRRPASVCCQCLRDLPKGEAVCYTCKRALQAEARKPVPAYVPQDYKGSLARQCGLKPSPYMEGGAK